jgi:hypothetical protein
MTQRWTAAILLITPLMILGQAPARKPWTPGRTADGQPDLQGVWTNPTITPFERPGELAGKATLSATEAAALEKKAAAGRVDRPPVEGDVGSYNQFWFDSGTKVVSTRQTSLVVDPPDGRVPVKPEAEEKRDFNLEHNADSYVYMSTWDRCITRGIPGAMFPAGYNNAYEIVQLPGYVIIHYEMIHNVRVIPLDGRPHLPANIRQWDGDPRGHWEGNTLVVQTTNFNGRTGAQANGNLMMTSDALELVERFTRTGPDTIQYEVTVTDPKTWTRPWGVSFPLRRDPGYGMFEYACHEGNHSLFNILSGARADDREAEKAARK